MRSIVLPKNTGNSVVKVEPLLELLPLLAGLAKGMSSVGKEKKKKESFI